MSGTESPAVGLSLPELLERSGQVAEIVHSICPPLRHNGPLPMQVNAWTRQDVITLVGLLAGLQAAIVTPPNGFAEVAARLRPIGKIVQKIGRGEDPFDLGAEQELPILVNDLNVAIGESDKATRPADPLAFLDFAPLCDGLAQDDEPQGAEATSDKATSVAPPVPNDGPVRAADGAGASSRRRNARGGGRKKEIDDKTFREWVEYRKDYESAKGVGGFVMDDWLRQKGITKKEHRKRMDNTRPSTLERRNCRSNDADQNPVKGDLI